MTISQIHDIIEKIRPKTLIILVETDSQRNILQNGLIALKLQVDDDQLKKWLAFLDLLLKWNKTYNLTAIKSTEKMITHHLLDSLAIYPYLHKNNHIDVGTGAGIPGIPLAILLPEHHFTLIDSVGKKTRFIEHVKLTLNLENITVINQRVENYQTDLLFDTVISRAFASIQKMLHLTASLCATEGIFLAMKANIEDETLHLPYPYHVDRIEKIDVPGLDATRHIVLIHRAINKKP